MGLGLQCINAVRLAAEGATWTTIARATEDQARRTRLFGALDTLEHLRRGGRIGAAQALLGGMLSIKPVIEVRDGAVAEAGKVRTRSKSLKLLADKVAAATDPQQVFVFDAQAPDMDEMIELLAPDRRSRSDRVRHHRPGHRHARGAAHDRRRLGRRAVDVRPLGPKSPATRLNAAAMPG